MLKTILSVSGKPGLYKLVKSAKNLIIVESLENKRKTPIHTQDKVVSLGDISIYTQDDEIALREVLSKMKKKEDSAPITMPKDCKDGDYLKYMEEVLPNYDKERVYPSDIRKIVNWYNLLLKSEIDFEKIEEEKTEEGAKA